MNLSNPCSERMMPSCNLWRENEEPSFAVPAARQPVSDASQSPYVKIESLQRRSASLFAAVSTVAVSTRLAKAHVRHVVIGEHAMAAHGRIRNTEDMTIIAVDMEHAASCIASMHEGAVIHRAPGTLGCAVRAADGRKLADVWNDAGGAACRYAIDTAKVLDGVSVPSPEALMALTFEAISSDSRPRDKRAMDLSDLIYLVTHFRDQNTPGTSRSMIGVLVDGDSCGDPVRGRVRWETLYDAIIAGSPISI